VFQLSLTGAKARRDRLHRLPHDEAEEKEMVETEEKEMVETEETEMVETEEKEMVETEEVETEPAAVNQQLAILALQSVGR
jgi:hypothetical protein